MAHKMFMLIVQGNAFSHPKLHQTLDVNQIGMNHGVMNVFLHSVLIRFGFE